MRKKILSLFWIMSTVCAHDLAGFETLSVAELEKRAAQGSGEALNELGERYHFGRGVSADFQKARDFYLKSVSHNNPVAANHLARLYLNGEGVKRNPERAENWYKKSVELDPSDFNRCVNGLFPDRSFCSLLFKAYQGQVPSMLAVARSYQEGLRLNEKEIFPPCPSEAKKWLVKAAEQGNNLRAYSLLHKFCKDKFFPCQEGEADKWKQEGLLKGAAPKDFN